MNSKWALLESDSSDSSGSLVSEVTLGSCSDISSFGSGSDFSGSGSGSRSRLGSVTVAAGTRFHQHSATRKEEDKRGFSNPKPTHRSFSLYQYVFFWFWFGLLLPSGLVLCMLNLDVTEAKNMISNLQNIL
jgi:hypothetical protein